MKTVEELARNDMDLVKLVLERKDDLTDTESEAFSDMLRRFKYRNKGLSSKQRDWLEAVADKLDIVRPAANLVSSGSVPRGAEVPTPAILLNRPLKPPGK